MRVGTGFDVHAFCEGEFITLAGIKIPFHHAFEAHSDGDVLIHSLCDALLGALSLGDIGQHFPPHEKKWGNRNSSFFLTQIATMIGKQGYTINNIDNTIICEQPKMQTHILAMRKNLATILSLSLGQVSIKATTTEQLGFCGRGEGVAVQSICLLTKKL